MTDWRDFRGGAKRLEDPDLPRIGAEIGVGEDELHAFMDVEAAGSGFDKQGRPKLLFEPHVFYRNLTGTKRDRAVREGLAYKKWGEKSYPRDSYPRLVRAMKIDETAALKSASWGLTQVLGENYAMVGYDSPQDMVQDFMEDEENHLEAAVKFLVASGIDDEMRDLAALERPTRPEDCVGIVRVYNGPGYKKNNYHVKFAAAHNKWRKIPDTPWSPGEDAPPRRAPNPVVERAAEIAKEEITRDVQEALRTLGYPEVGKVDGRIGDKTRGAILSYRQTRGLPLTSEIDHDLLQDLQEAVAAGWRRPIAAERAEATLDDISDSEVVQRTERAKEETEEAERNLNFVQRIMLWLGIGAGGGGSVAYETINPDEVEEKLGLVQRVVAFVADNPLVLLPIIVLVIAMLYTAYARRRIARARDRVEAAQRAELIGFREGRHV